MELLIVGEAPSRTTSEPLSGRSGARIAELMGLTTETFVERFDRVNLLDEYPGSDGKGTAFPFLPAMARAFELREGPWTHYLLLGRRVAGAFGLRDDAEFLRWYELVGLRIVVPDGELFPRSSEPKRAVVLPHPSGIVRWWNTTANRRAARAFLRRLERETRVVVA